MDQARVLLGCLARVAHLPFIKPHYILGLTGLSYTRQPPFRWNSSSSKQWLTRQRSDPFVKAAQSQHYRARSAFKLIQMNEKYRFLRRGAIVVDCGAAPGGWAQVAAEKVVSKSHSTVVDALSIDARKPDTDDLSNDTLCEPTTKIENPNAKTQDGSVIAIDLLPIEPIPGVTVIQGNFLEPRVQAQVRHALGRRRVDVVCSDMAPSFSGNHCSDHAKSMVCNGYLATSYVVRHTQHFANFCIFYTISRSYANRH